MFKLYNPFFLGLFVFKPSSSFLKIWLTLLKWLYLSSYYWLV